MRLARLRNSEFRHDIKLYRGALFAESFGVLLLIQAQTIVTAARVHFLRASCPDPHGLDEHQAISIHMSACFIIHGSMSMRRD